MICVVMIIGHCPILAEAECLPMNAPRIALVSAVAARGTDPDEQPVVDALTAAGMVVSVEYWDDPAVRWGDYDVAILRSTWDYMDRMPEFFAWLGAASAMTNLHNPVALIRWSIDKHYFAHLAAAGVPIVPTLFVEPEEDPTEALCTYQKFVIKPCIGSGSRGVSSYATDEFPQHSVAANQHAKRLLNEGKSIMVQPLIKSVPAKGEMPMVFFGEQFSHAASKRVSIPTGGSQVEGLFAPEDNRPTSASTFEIEVATQAVRAIPRFGLSGPLLYSRVDLVWGDDGKPLVLELELAEPSLFFPQAPSAVQNFVDAVQALTA
jgi:glutathione synthase/RimK-type ligase-like ATP-grasp enzyme